MTSFEPGGNPWRKPAFHGTLLLLPLLVLLGSAGVYAEEAAASKPPETRRHNVAEVLHGVKIVDPYRWLEDQESPETRAWIDAQNEYTDARLGSVPGRESLEKRLAELMRIDTIGVPRARNGRYFFSKKKADQDLSVIYMRKGLAGEDEALIDPHPMSPEHTTSVSVLDVSEDGSLLLYGVRQGGEDELTPQLIKVDTRETLPDRLIKARYFSFSLTPDNRGFYYTRFEEEGPRVYYHAIGSDSGQDVQVFGEGYGREKIITASLSEDGRHLLIHVLHGSSADKTEVYYQDVAAQSPVVPIVNDIEARFFGAVGGDHLFLHTNWEAPKGRIVAVDLGNPAREHWKEIVPESDSVIEEGGLFLAGGQLLIHYLESVRSRVKVFSPAGESVGDITLPALGSVRALRSGWGQKEAFYAFASFHVPTTIYRYNVAQGTQQVWAQLAVPVDTGKFMVRQVWYQSKDKTLVPMFLVHRKGLRLDGTNPTLMTGYGGFNLSRTPYFSSSAVLWVERGGVFALPNLRGGGEFGEEWHRAGMLEKKQNVFDDFIAAAEWLIQNGYTHPSKLAIAGGSNGGLLVGAALTQHPDLFQAVICAYPLLDMVRYHKFLVARFWVPEYGSSEDPEQFKYLYAYSPYHQVKPGTEYPAVLFTTGDADTRVAPLHARKMAALLQSATGSERPVLLDYDTESGHVGGAAPVSKRIEDLANQFSFLVWQLGLTPASSESQ
jgi:prolyl oligopeptidase